MSDAEKNFSAFKKESPDEKQPVTFIYEVEVGLPESETGYIIRNSEWRRLRDMVNKMGQPSRIYVTSGGILVGAGLSTVFIAINLPANSRWDVFTWVMSAVLFVAGVFLLVFHYLFLSKQAKLSREEVISYLEEIESGFKNNDQN